MGGGEIIAIIISALILIGALIYIIRAKKRGQKCIGCPNASRCGKDGAPIYSCSSDKEKSE